MAIDEGADEVIRHAAYMGRLVGTNVIDAVFLVAVAAINWVAGWGLGFLELEGMDLFFQRCLQGVFGFVSVVSVVVHLGRNLVVAIARAARGQQ